MFKKSLRREVDIACSKTIKSSYTYTTNLEFRGKWYA